MSTEANLSDSAAEQAAATVLQGLLAGAETPPAQETAQETADTSPEAEAADEATADAGDADVEAAGEPDETAPAADATQEEVSLDDKSLAILARREKEQKAAHSKAMAEVEARMAEAQKQMAEIAETRKRIDAYETELRVLKYDPVSVLEKLGLSKQEMQDMATQLFYHNMGEDAPPEHKARKYTASVEARLARVEDERRRAEEQRKQQEQAAAAEQYQRQYKSALTSLVSAMDSQKFPNLAVYREAVGEQLPEELFAMAVNMANANGGDPTHEEVLQAAEEKLAKLYAPVRKSAEKQPTKPAPKTIKGRQTATTKPSRQPNHLDEEELEANAAAKLRSLIGA